MWRLLGRTTGSRVYSRLDTRRGDLYLFCRRVPFYRRKNEWAMTDGGESILRDVDAAARRYFAVYIIYGAVSPSSSPDLKGSCCLLVHALYSVSG